MGHVPRPLLVVVAALLALCVVGGFVIGLMPSLKRGAGDDDDTAAAAAPAASSAAVKDATPLAEPPRPAAQAQVGRARRLRHRRLGRRASLNAPGPAARRSTPY